MQAAGGDPAGLGPDQGLLGRLDCYVELHIEQGRKLAGLDAAIAWPRASGRTAGGGWTYRAR